MTATYYREFVVAGPATERQVQLLRQFCRRHGLTFHMGNGLLRPGVMLKLRQDGGPEQSSTWTEEGLEKIQLPESMRLNEQEAEAYRTVLRDAGVETAADLARMGIEVWLQPEAGITPRTAIATRVIDFMISRGIPFQDIDPARVFKTTIEPDNEFIDVRVYNCLMREGLRWVEILPFFSALALLDMRNFGTKGLERVEVLLDHHGLSLLPPLGR